MQRCIVYEILWYEAKVQKDVSRGAILRVNGKRTL